MSFLEGEIVIINEHAKNGIPSRIGEKGIIVNRDYYRNSPNYEYVVQFDDGMTSPVREVELNKLTQNDEEIMKYTFTGNLVTYTPTGETVKILKCDFLHRQIEVEFEDAGIMVVGIETLKPIEEETWRIVEQPEKSLETVQEEMLHMFFSQYKNNDNTYTVPKELLVNMLNRIYEEVK